jgi:electron transfer flavoprotein beta subunit
MTARTKPLTVVEPVMLQTLKQLNLKTSTKSAVKLINADNLDELINLLHNEAKSNLINSRKSKSRKSKKIAFAQ